jgi:hypothetical protein
MSVHDEGDSEDGHCVVTSTEESTEVGVYIAVLSAGNTRTETLHSVSGIEPYLCSIQCIGGTI